MHFLWSFHHFKLSWLSVKSYLIYYYKKELCSANLLHRVRITPGMVPIGLKGLDYSCFSMWAFWLMNQFINILIVWSNFHGTKMKIMQINHLTALIITLWTNWLMTWKISLVNETIKKFSNRRSKSSNVAWTQDTWKKICSSIFSKTKLGMRFPNILLMSTRKLLSDYSCDLEACSSWNEVIKCPRNLDKRYSKDQAIRADMRSRRNQTTPRVSGEHRMVWRREGKIKTTNS